MKGAYAWIGMCLMFAGQCKAEGAHSWYVSGGITEAFLKDPRTVIQNAPTPGATLFITNGLADGGFGGQVAVGRVFGPIRAEFEYGHSDTDAKLYVVTSPINNTLPQTGGDSVDRFMVNGFYDMPLSRAPLRPYRGVGLGGVGVRVKTKASRPFGPPTAPSQLIDESLGGFAWQVVAGISYPVTRRLALTAQYRYLDAGTLDGHDTRGQPFRTDIAGHNIDVGLRLSF